MNLSRFRTHSLLVFLLAIGGVKGTAEVNHELFTAVLSEHVDAGLVDYAAIAHDARLATYLEGFARTDPATLEGRNEKLAFWINAYNAFTLKLVAEAYPIKSIHELGTGGRIIGWLFKRTPWDIRFAEIGGKTYTLNEIEHDILRVEFAEPRIHFAIVCAAVSCPPLRAEAYLPDRLDEQLDEQARLFLADRRHNRFDVEQKQAWLSPIFSWFEEDFGGSEKSVMQFIAPFLESAETSRITATASAWSVNYTDYDWALNDQRDDRR